MNADHRGVSRNALYKSMLLTYLLTYLLKGPIFFEAEVVFSWTSIEAQSAKPY